MLEVIRRLIRITDWLLTIIPRLMIKLLGIAVNPRLGPLRLVVAPVVLYVMAALLLVYVYAPIRAYTGLASMGPILDYTNERSLGTALQDNKGRFVGIFDPELDSQRDFLKSELPVKLPGYFTAWPDHKSQHVSQVPPHFWACLAYHEDRYLGQWRNPYGIDLVGVLKIPYSTVSRSLSSGRLRIGVGGSTLAMQLARVFFKQPPDASETARDKIGRKLREWWVAPVIQHMLRGNGDYRPLRQWAANHLPMGQRTGGQPLYGVEQAALVIFNKPASALTRAEQYVLAAAVNQPVIVLEGSKRLNRVRLKKWRRIVEKRAGQCARHLPMTDRDRISVLAALTSLADHPPTPSLANDRKIELSLGEKTTRLVSANPVRRANTLLPAVRYGVRAQMKQTFGYNWRAYVRTVSLTLDGFENYRFRQHVLGVLATLQKRFKARLSPSFTLDVAAKAKPGIHKQMPDIIIAAADENGRLVRYFESNFNAAYFGSQAAIDRASGYYDAARETRAIASVAKMLGAVAIINNGGDQPGTTYPDPHAPAAKLIDTCKHGGRRARRRPEVVFACSLNAPLESRLKRIRQAQLVRLVQAFGMNLPDMSKGGANPYAAVARGHVMASPRYVHRMAAALLAALTGHGQQKIELPTLIAAYDKLSAVKKSGERPLEPYIIPDRLPIKKSGLPYLKRLLSAPLCLRSRRRGKITPEGTLKFIHQWCADDNPKVRLHIAKTGTRGTSDPDPANDDTIDLWVAGGIQFANGKRYSYIALIGTGETSRLLGRDLYSGRTLSPLVDLLLQDLQKLAFTPTHR